MEWVYNIPVPPFKCDFMIDLSKIIKNIDAYGAQQQGYGNPLQLFMSIKGREEAKPHGENPFSRKNRAQNFNMYSTYLFIHLNGLTESLLKES